MGCPYEAQFFFGIEMNKKKRDEFVKEMETNDSLTEDDWFDDPQNDFEQNGKEYYLDLNEDFSYALTTTNCDYAKTFSIDKAEAMKEKAIEKFRKSEFLQRHFKESEIKMIVMCKYTG